MTRTPKQPVGQVRPRSVPDLGGCSRRVRVLGIGQVAVLDLAGPLSDVVEELDLATRVSLATGPRAVVCVASSVVEVDAPGALRGLALSGRHPRDWPGVPVAVAGLSPVAGDTLRQLPLGGHLMVSASLREALSLVLQAPCPTVVSRRLAPHPTAPRAGRDFVSRTLLDWQLGSHVAAACLVVSELVTNAMIHCGTDIELTLARSRQAVRIGVRDGGPGLPTERRGGFHNHGRGLTIVAALSSAWGVLPTAEGGKVVWAVLLPPDPVGCDPVLSRGRAPGRPRARVPAPLARS